MKTSVKNEIEQCLENNFRYFAARKLADYNPRPGEPNGAEIYERVKKSALEDIEQVVDDYTRDLNDELIDLAVEIVLQYGYKIGDGIYSTGGMSVVESAFSVLAQNNMLDKDGNYSVYMASV